MLAKSVMNKKVVTVKEDETLESIIGKFSKHGISGAPVVKGRKPVGIISDSDIIDVLDIYTRINADNFAHLALIFSVLQNKGLDKFKAEMKVAKRIKAKDIMTRTPVVMKESDSLTKVAMEMNKKDINRVIIVDGKGDIKGIIARKDIINALAIK